MVGGRLERRPSGLDGDLPAGPSGAPDRTLQGLHLDHLPAVAGQQVAGGDAGAVARELRLAPVGVQDPHPGRPGGGADHEDPVAAGAQIGMTDPLRAGRRQLERQIGLLDDQVGVADPVPLLEPHRGRRIPAANRRGGGAAPHRRLPATPDAPLGRRRFGAC